MAKNRNRGKSRGGANLFERAQRELAKGNAKTAVKDAEACFRQDPPPEHRLLLERACWALAPDAAAARLLGVCLLLLDRFEAAEAVHGKTP